MGAIEGCAILFGFFASVGIGCNKAFLENIQMICGVQRQVFFGM